MVPQGRMDHKTPRTPPNTLDTPTLDATPLGARTRDLGHKHMTIELTANLRLLDYHPNITH